MQFLAAIEPLYVLTGFCVGVLVGMTGVGGGSVMTPLLIVLFGAHPAIAVGTDLTFAAATKTVGALVHGATRTIEWRIVGLLALGSIPATLATLLVLSMFDLNGAAARQRDHAHPRRHVVHDVRFSCSPPTAFAAAMPIGSATSIGEQRDC